MNGAHNGALDDDLSCANCACHMTGFAKYNRIGSQIAQNGSAKLGDAIAGPIAGYGDASVENRAAFLCERPTSIGRHVGLWRLRI